MRPQLIFAAFLSLTLLAAAPAQAYTYASPQSDPLIAGREAFLAAVNGGDWPAAEQAAATFKPDLDLLEKGEESFNGDPGISEAFTKALAAKNADAAKAALRRATIDQIDRRLSSASQNITTYQTASTLIASALAFFSALEGDLPADTRQTISAELQKALDAVGKPGVFGYGAQDPDPAALAAAHDKILSALRAAPQK